MKKKLALLAALLLIFSVLLSFSSCAPNPEDIGTAKNASDTLEFNFYETTLVNKADDLAAVGADGHLSAYVKGEKDGDTVLILYCKSTSVTADARAYLEGIATEEQTVGTVGKIVYLATEDGLSAATTRPWLTQLYHTFIEDDNYMYVVKGLGNTLLITLGALVIGVFLGILVAVAKYYAEGNPKLRFINWICDTYTTVIRGIPVTVLLFIFFFVILVSADGLLVAILAFGINSGAYMAELVRSGINAVDRGQMEAARSLGMSKWQAMRAVVFPQAVKNILPAIGNECIALLKETSVAGYVAVVDLTRGVNLIRNNTFDALNPLMLAALVYLGLVILMTKLLSILERRLSKSEKR